MRPWHSSNKHTTVTAKHGHKKETAATKEDSSYRRKQPKDTCGSTWNAQEKRREAAADFKESLQQYKGPLHTSELQQQTIKTEAADKATPRYHNNRKV